MGMLPTIMLLLMFQKDSNLISVIASVIPSNAYAITFLVKLTEILMYSDFTLVRPLHVSFLVLNHVCFVHGVRAWLPNSNTFDPITKDNDLFGRSPL